MKKKMLSFDKQRSSGAIINTCGFIDGEYVKDWKTFSSACMFAAKEV